MSFEDKLKQKLEQLGGQVSSNNSIVDAVMRQIEEGAVEPPGSHRIRNLVMKNLLTKYVAAAVVIVAIIVGVSVFSVSPDGANIAWAEMIEAMKAQQWIHAVFEYEVKDRGRTSEMWISVDPMVMAMKVEGNEISHYDSAKKICHKYNYVENTVTIDSMSGKLPVGFDRLSPVDFVEMMIKDMVAFQLPRP